MTDKEQLEEIKRQSEYIELSNAEKFIVYQDMKMKKEHYDWLIEQAERVQELEREQLKNDDYTWGLLMEIKRYREVLSIISANLPLDSREHYVSIARKSLEESK